MLTLISGIAFTCFLALGLYLGQEPSSPSQKVLILLGPPGSGKGTQAVKLSKELGLPHISTGDLFRENVSKGTSLGQQAKTYIDEGKLVPDEIVLKMLFQRISMNDCLQGYLLDGVPRTLVQAEALEKIFKEAQVIALNLNVSNEVIVKRLSGRYSCRKCGAIYNVHSNPPIKEKICDQCGSELYQRADDKEEVIKERLKIYHLQTQPLIAFYEAKHVLSHVAGEKEAEQVFKDLLNQYSRSS